MALNNIINTLKEAGYKDTGKSLYHEFRVPDQMQTHFNALHALLVAQGYKRIKRNVHVQHLTHEYKPYAYMRNVKFPENPSENYTFLTIQIG